MTENKRFEIGEYTTCRYDIAEIIDEEEEIVCVVATNDVEYVISVLNENETLKNKIRECEEKK